LGVQIALQNEDSGYLVDDLFPGICWAAGGVEMAMCLRGAEALIPQNDREF
jgi:hypothetical protein